MKKFKRAVTDSEAKVRYAEGKDGVNNLTGWVNRRGGGRCGKRESNRETTQITNINI